MGSKTGIEWTDSTWNPFIGCSRVSEGCRHCYAERLAGRFSNNSKAAAIYAGTTKAVNGLQVWTGKINQAPEGTLLKPLSWKPVRFKNPDGGYGKPIFLERPRRIFVNPCPTSFTRMPPTSRSRRCLR